MAWQDYLEEVKTFVLEHATLHGDGRRICHTPIWPMLVERHDMGPYQAQYVRTMTIRSLTGAGVLRRLDRYQPDIEVLI